MHRPVFTIALIAAGLAPALNAEDAIKASLTGQIQVRAEVASSYQGNTGPYSPAEGSTGKTDTADFYLRRARFGAKFESASKQWTGAFVLRADRSDQNPAAAVSQRIPALHQVFISRNFSNPEGDLKQSIQGGLDYAFFNRADYGPSGANLLANQRATHRLLAQRGVGIGYRLATKEVKFGLDIQNNNSDSQTTLQTGGQNASRKEGLWYSTRIELSPPESTGWNIDKYQETWGGAEGQGVLLSAEFGYNSKAQSVTGTTRVQTSKTVMGSELLFRQNGLVLLGEARLQRNFIDQTDTTTVNNTTCFKNDNSAVVYVLQGGYAIPSDFISTGSSLELAARWTFLDNNRENQTANATRSALNENGAFGAEDYGTTSGRQVDIGLNYYDYIDMAKDGKGAKTSIVYTNWHSEMGGSRAHVFRIQQQISF